MRDLSLHLLDLIENSLRASASVITVTFDVCEKSDCVTVRIDDNGNGFTAPHEAVLSPFYTTKKGKRTGLGLSLLRESAEQAGGKLEIGQSDLGGARVSVSMQLSHPDRRPIGDLGATFSAMSCASPNIDFRLQVRTGRGSFEVSTRELAGRMDPHKLLDGYSLALEVRKRVWEGMEKVWPAGVW